MALATSTTRQVALSTTAAALDGGAFDPDAGSNRTVLVNATADCFVGFTSGVLSTTGFRIPSGSTLTVRLKTGQRLYGILASSTATAYVLEQVSP